MLMQTIGSLALWSAAIINAAACAEADADRVAKQAASTKSAEQAKSRDLAALEKKLLGTWQGPACGGNYTFKSDGTFTLESFTPGGNTLTGNWSMRWDALPPTLVVTCKTSDFKSKDPTRDEYKYLGVALELEVLKLNDDSFVYRHPDHKSEQINERRQAKPATTK